MRKRVKEVLCENGISKFYPQYNFYGLGWFSFAGTNKKRQAIYFDNLQKAKKYLKMNQNIIIHEVT